MKQQADKHHQERQFSVGDWVQPYIQQSVAKRSSQKLSFRFFGPYLILERVGQVAYKLQLPANGHIHHVVHISQLKKALSPATTVSPNADLAFIKYYCRWSSYAGRANEVPEGEAQVRSLRQSPVETTPRRVCNVGEP
jgi:hypothetical protein